MPWYTKKIISGNVVEIYRYFSVRKRKKSYLPRTENMNVTPEEKQVINIREARMKLTRIINTNFTKNDVFVRLSYRKKNVQESDATKDYRKFNRRLKYYIRKNKLPELKYVGVTEKGSGKIHHHIIMNFTDINKILEIWGHGGVYCVPLWSEDYAGLAMYITKETIRHEHGRRWTQSRNLEKPIEIVDEYKGKTMSAPKMPKGHTLIESQCYATSLGHKTWYMKSVKMGYEYLEAG